MPSATAIYRRLFACSSWNSITARLKRRQRVARRARLALLKRRWQGQMPAALCSRRRRCSLRVDQISILQSASLEEPTPRFASSNRIGLVWARTSLRLVHAFLEQAAVARAQGSIRRTFRNCALLQQPSDHHADRHRDDEDDYTRRQGGEIFQGRPGAKPGQAPADPERQRTGHQRPVDVGPCWPLESRGQERRPALLRPCKADTGDG